jgi:hypothetical protein
MRVLVSYHLIHEVLLNRPGFVEEADQLWELMRSGQIQGYMTQQGLDIIYLDLLDAEGENKAEEILCQIKKVVGICSITRTIREQARVTRFSGGKAVSLSSVNSTIRVQARVSQLDYESAIELVCAIENGFDAIVTQHPQSFNEDDLVITATDLLHQQRGESTSLKIIQQLNDAYYNNKSLPLVQFCPLEVNRYLTYRIRSSITTALKVFEIIKEKGISGINSTELATKAGLSEKTTNSIVLDLQNFHIIFRQDGKILVKPSLLNWSHEKITDYLAETLKCHVVTQEVYKQLRPGELITRWRLQELIADVSPQEKSVIPKSSRDYISRMLPWFFFTGLLEDRGNGRIARPIGVGKQKGKLKEDSEVQQLELFAEDWNSDPSLVEAHAAGVSVTSQKTSSHHRYAIDLLDELPGQRLFKTPEAVDQYLQEERDSWDN